MNDISNNELTIEEGESIEIVSEIPDNIMNSFSISFTLQNLIIFNVFLSLSYAIYWVYYMPLLLFEGVGYIGAKEFNLTYIYIYLIYTILFNITRISSFFEVYPNEDLIITKEEEENEQINALLLVCCIIFSIWISKLVIHFIRKLNNLSQDELKILQDIRHIENLRIIIC